MPRQIPKNKKALNRDGKTPVQDYLQAREQRNNRLWKLIKGTFYTRFNGDLMTAKRFDEKFPINLPVNLNRCKDNPDKRNAYLN